MEKRLTVGDLKKKLQDVPDWVPVELVSDTGVDQGLGDIVVEDAYYQSPYYNNYRCFCIVAEDTGENE